MRVDVRRISFVLACLGGVVLVGCGIVPGFFGGATGTLRLMVTDKPFPVEFIDEALVTITRIDVRRSDDGEDAGSDGLGNDDASSDDASDSNGTDDDSEGEGGDFITVFEGEKTVDLLDLRNGRMDVLAETDVPVGHYDQMRLVVTNGRITLTDGRVFDLDVPSGEQTGIKLHFEFEVTDEEPSVLLLDVDLSRAFSAIPSGRIDDVSTIREFRFQPSLAMRLIAMVEAGSIAGRVVDETTVPVSGVMVTAFKGETEITSTVSDDDGTFALVGLPAGTYRVEFSATGFLDTSIEGIEVEAGQTFELGDVVLTPAGP
ncbi:MAG: hypothetical protein DCC65_02210 [Planctomycetota bacterium]|nr:MAG: hypothetical protein DCC65_02210 [Planctomycetota bacterium]